MTEVCRAKSAQGPYVDRDDKACAGEKDGKTNGSGTLILESHSPDGNGRYEVLAPGSVGIVVSTLDPLIDILINPQSPTCLHLAQYCTESICALFTELTPIKQETTEGVIMTYQYKNQTVPNPVEITMYYGHNYLKFDGQGWPFLSATP